MPLGVSLAPGAADGSAAAQNQAALHRATLRDADSERSPLHPLVIDLDREALPPSMAAELLVCALRTSPTAALAAMAAAGGSLTIPSNSR